MHDLDPVDNLNRVFSEPTSEIFGMDEEKPYKPKNAPTRLREWWASLSEDERAALASDSKIVDPFKK
ncbi:hypothetical protein RhoFasSB10_02302 [Rhodococcus fascians]|nr:hypothetical protein [Rhodococcus fascians]